MLKTDKILTEEKRVYLIRLAGFIALGGNLVLAFIKFFLGKISGSLAVTGDAIDTMTDVAIALMTIIVSRIISRPGDKEHPWGGVGTRKGRNNHNDGSFLYYIFCRFAACSIFRT